MVLAHSAENTDHLHMSSGVCSAATCFNGGRCAESGELICRCPAGFKGTRCQYGEFKLPSDEGVNIQSLSCDRKAIPHSTSHSISPSTERWGSLLEALSRSSSDLMLSLCTVCSVAGISWGCSVGVSELLNVEEVILGEMVSFEGWAFTPLSRQSVKAACLYEDLLFAHTWLAKYKTSVTSCCALTCSWANRSPAY